jgi:acetamidase/formamidase
VWAYGFASMVGDCRVSQVVDVRNGVHCMIAKDIFKGQKKPVATGK